MTTTDPLPETKWGDRDFVLYYCNKGKADEQHKALTEKMTAEWYQAVEFLLKNCPFCYLATNGPTQPELSVMFHVWDTASQRIVLSTPKDVKYENMLFNKNVAITLHNFEGQAATQSLFKGVCPVAVTLYGQADICSGTDENASREQHTGKHGQYASAYIGADKAVCKVRVDDVLLSTVQGVNLRFRDKQLHEALAAAA